jgi:hypothetical protein
MNGLDKTRQSSNTKSINGFRMDLKTMLILSNNVYGVVGTRLEYPKAEMDKR